jgi:hypothetical protein
MILQKQISSATVKSETRMRPMEVFGVAMTGRTLEFSVSCVCSDLVFLAAKRNQQGQITVLEDALRNIVLTSYICNEIAKSGVQAAWVALDEQSNSPDLFLFPCPVDRCLGVFVYCRCYGNICADTYRADALAIKSLEGRGKMNRKLSLLLFVVMLGFPVFSRAQSASGIIDASRMIDWSQVGVVGGIPTRSTVCATLNPGASASQINSAIASCPSGQVVYLNAGTYNLSSGIDFAGHSNVTVRGAGSDKTFISFSSGAGCNGLNADVCIEGANNYQNSPDNTATWTAGYAKGTTQITLSNVNNLHVGTSILILDQQDNASDPGTAFVCATTGVCSMEGPSGSGRSGRAQEQLVQVQAISGNTVTITPGLYMSNWNASQSPGAWWSSSVISNDGIEDVSLDHSGSSASSGISIYGAINCWVKNVRSLNSNRNHVWLLETIHSTVRDSYFYGTQNAASQSYGVEMYMTSDDLIENNIFQHVAAPVLPNGSVSGNVIAYNFSTDDYYAGTSWMAYANQLHGAGTDMALFEGNESNGFIADPIHGTHNFITVFRNEYAGWESGKTGQTIPINLASYSRYFNVIGNVLGHAGYHTQYEDVAPNGSNPDRSIYVLGYSALDGATGSFPNDPNVATTLLRWGNYDVVTGSVKWDTSEVPSGLSQYANAVPSTQALPASFFLSGKPSWWGTPWGNPPWPAIGPDVTGGPGPGGHSYANPAQLCYTNTSKDSNGVLNFNADSCYTSSPAPAAPIGLGAVAH